MYDEHTVELITAAPPLPGLDLADLPQELTRAFSEIVSLRLLARTEVPSRLEESLDTLRRLANTYEAYVSLLPTAEHRSSAAFVAGSARHVMYLARVLYPERGNTSSYLTRDAIPAELSACLLFLIAGYTADASRMARHLQNEQPSSTASTLMQSLAHLASGQLWAVLELAIPVLRNTELDSLETLALDALWHRLHRRRSPKRRCLRPGRCWTHL